MIMCHSSLAKSSICEFVVVKLIIAFYMEPLFTIMSFPINSIQGPCKASRREPVVPSIPDAPLALHCLQRGD